MTKIATVTNFDANLLKIYEEKGGQIIQDAVVFGAESLRNDFRTVVTRDKAPLIKVDIKDGLRAASDTFTGQNVLAVKSRIADFRDADIDLEITNSDVKELYRSYLGWIMNPTRTEAEVRDNPFELFFVNQVVAKHLQFVRMKTSWKGVYHATNIGANNIADGLIAKITAGIVATTIADTHVFESTAISTSNAYAQVNGVAALVAAADETLLYSPMQISMSQATYDKYRANRRTLFPNFVGPQDRPTTHDDHSNMTFKVDPGLSGKDTIVVTPPDNLIFCVNEDPGSFSINIVRQAKSWQISIRISAGFDFATGDWMFTNDAV